MLCGQKAPPTFQRVDLLDKSLQRGDTRKLEEEKRAVLASNFVFAQDYIEVTAAGGIVRLPLKDHYTYPAVARSNRSSGHVILVHDRIFFELLSNNIWFRKFSGKSCNL